MIILFLLLIIIFVLLVLCNKSEPYCNASSTCNHTKCKHIRQYKNHNPDYKLGHKCYAECLKNAKCAYTGIGFDCYNNCFDNIQNRGHFLDGIRDDLL